MAVIGRYDSDNLIADNAHVATVQTVKIAAGEGDLKRGTVLANDGDTYKVLSDSTTGKAEVILATDTDATGSSEVVADAYNSGDFFENALIVGEGYTITDADKLNMKNAGIYVIAGIDF